MSQLCNNWVAIVYFVIIVSYCVVIVVITVVIVVVIIVVITVVIIVPSLPIITVSRILRVVYSVFFSVTNWENNQLKSVSVKKKTSHSWGRTPSNEQVKKSQTHLYFSVFGSSSLESYQEFLMQPL